MRLGALAGQHLDRGQLFYNSSPPPTDEMMVFYAIMLQRMVILDQGHHGLINEINWGLTHALGAGLIIQPVDQQSSVLLLCY